MHLCHLDPHCGVPPSQMRASQSLNSSEPPSLCQHRGKIQAVFGALPQLSLQQPPLLAYWQASALWPGNLHQTWRGCGALSQTIVLPKLMEGAQEGDGCGRRRCDCVSICECAFICRNMGLLNADTRICGGSCMWMSEQTRNIQQKFIHESVW